MRVGVSSRGNTWISMGPAGWLIAGPFILAFYVAWFAIVLIVAIVKGIVALVRELRN